MAEWDGDGSGGYYDDPRYNGENKYDNEPEPRRDVPLTAPPQEGLTKTLYCKFWGVEVKKIYPCQNDRGIDACLECSHSYIQVAYSVEIFKNQLNQLLTFVNQKETSELKTELKTNAILHPNRFEDID